MFLEKRIIIMIMKNLGLMYLAPVERWCITASWQKIITAAINRINIEKLNLILYFVCVYNNDRRIRNK